MQHKYIFPTTVNQKTIVKCLLYNNLRAGFYYECLVAANRKGRYATMEKLQN